MITEKQSRFLVCGATLQSRDEIAQMLRRIGFTTIDEADDASRAEALMLERQYALAVCEGSHNSAEVMQLLYSAMRRRESGAASTVVLVTGDESCADMLHEVCRSTKARCLIRPFTAAEFCDAVLGLLSSRDSLPVKDSRSVDAPFKLDDGLEVKITETLHNLGIPAHIKGFNYLRCAIGMTVADPDVINYVTKLIYPGVARTFDTTTSRVERAIRHAIEVAWDRGDVDTLNSYFGYTISRQRGKPTNSEFIAMISDKLRLALVKR